MTTEVPPSSTPPDEPRPTARGPRRAERAQGRSAGLAPRPRRVTISDLARRLDISKASVSYALNGRQGVSEETRQRVLSLAEELGFHPNSAAVALSASRTRTIGIVIAREPSLISTETFYMRTLFGIEQYLNEVDGSLLLRLTGENGEDLDVYRRWGRQGRVDGFLLFDEREDDPRAPLLRELGVPCVVVTSVDRDDGAGRLVTSQDGTVTLLLDHLAGLGHTNVAHISGPLAFLHERNRVERLTAATRARGMRLTHVEGSYHYDDGAAKTRLLLEGPNPPTALILSNDLMSVAALRAAADIGTVVPDDVSIVSWDDSTLCEVARPGITAIDHQPMTRGRRAAEFLVDIVAGGTETIRMSPPATLTLRGSTAAARRTT